MVVRVSQVSLSQQNELLQTSDASATINDISFEAPPNSVEELFVSWQNSNFLDTLTPVSNSPHAPQSFRQYCLKHLSGHWN